ncbi:MAG: hypothetical protein ABI222_05650 [Opitutaceae bacterium]
MFLEAWGVLLTAYVMGALFTGKIFAKRVVLRENQPGWFWFMVCLNSFVAATSLLFGTSMLDFRS